MRRLLLSLACLIAAAATPAAAQEPVFRDYDHMRAVLDANMMHREIATVMRAFGASDEMTTEQLAALQARVRTIYPQDFEHVDVLIRRDMGNGWGRELYAYWTDTAYIFATVLYHQQEDATKAISFRFNTDFDDLVSAF